MSSRAHRRSRRKERRSRGGGRGRRSCPSSPVAPSPPWAEVTRAVLHRPQPPDRPLRAVPWHLRSGFSVRARTRNTAVRIAGLGSVPRGWVGGWDGTRTPGRRPPITCADFKRMEAFEFPVRYDDGVAHGLHDADVVLVGVSRTSKTPLSIYLGYLGHKAANVPVVKGIAAPPELFEVDHAKVVGLTIDANRLLEIRRARVRAMGAPARNRKYAELAEIYEELEQAEQLHRRLGCPVIDISELSIEETAHRILRVVDERAGDTK